jgi:hypothetical protein
VEEKLRKRLESWRRRGPVEQSVGVGSGKRDARANHVSWHVRVRERISTLMTSKELNRPQNDL